MDERRAWLLCLSSRVEWFRPRERSPAKDRSTPTQKPVALMRWCIERLKLKPGSTILDPYMGSAPVGVAAAGRGSFLTSGIEKDADYFEIAKRRLQDRAMPLFDSVRPLTTGSRFLAL